MLVVTSDGWRRAWLGSGSPGATAEADALKSWFNNDQEDFNRRLRLVTLPGDEEVIPEGLDRIVRHRIRAFDAHGMEALLRDLTDQPEYPPSPLGTRQVLPPRIASDSDPGAETSSLIGRGEHGELSVVGHPVGLPLAIQQVIDDFVSAEQLAFERNEGAAARLFSETEAVVAHHSSVRFRTELNSPSIVSYVVECEYVLPGAATSFQRTVGLTFRRSDGRQLGTSEMLVDEPTNLLSVQQAFLAAARQELGDHLTATAVPAGVTLAVRPDRMGFCTTRYDVGPGVVGAPVIWVPHIAIARTYRPEFRRLLRATEP